MATNSQLRWMLRGCIVIFILGSIGFVAADSTADVGVSQGATANLTVISTHQFHEYDSKLYAFQGGKMVYESNRRWDQYIDIDLVADDEYAVRVVAVDGYECSGNESGCYEIAYVRLNLQSHKQTVLWNHTMVGNRLASKKGYRYHDIDKLNESHLLVAGIRYDRVFIVNVTSGEIPYEWNAEEHFDRGLGGPHPDDWTHLNDVEQLEDGRIMASVRNQDQVVFLKNGNVQESWTLGCEDCHDILYEQHNPDYITEQHGGPAILVADSENNRVVEYHRKNSSWEMAWSWSDSHLRWPRDADRLPNGNTLVVDSNGNRVLEVTPEGQIVWVAKVPTPYDVERLGTGNESDGGTAVQNHTTSSPSPQSGKLRNGILFVLPMGISIPDALILLSASVAGLTMIIWDIKQWRL